MFFRLKTGNKVRGHNWALAKDHFKLDIRQCVFSQRTVNEWNKLPGECVNATSVNMFKNKLDDYFRRTTLKNRLINNKKYREPRTFDKPRASLSCCHPNVHVSILCTWGGSPVKSS